MAPGANSPVTSRTVNDRFNGSMDRPSATRTEIRKNDGVKTAQIGSVGPWTRRGQRLIDGDGRSTDRGYCTFPRIGSFYAGRLYALHQV
jgi:hypothetical protein